MSKKERDAEILTHWKERHAVLVARLASMEIGPDRTRLVQDIRALNAKIEASYSVRFEDKG